VALVSLGYTRPQTATYSAIKKIEIAGRKNDERI
jgi:hypothetical protein